MRTGITFFFLLISALVFSQRSPISPSIRKLKNDTIIWKADSLLRQPDFKAKPKSNGPMGLSAIGLFLYPTESGGEFLFNVEALFVKSKSYLVKYSEYVLKHEQTHFDIAELHARMLRKRIIDTDFKKIKNIQLEIDKLYQKTMREYTKEQDNYDRDTEHGLNSAKQKIWNDEIARRLKEMDNYSNLPINIAN